MKMTGLRASDDTNDKRTEDPGSTGAVASALRTIIFESDTARRKAFDLLLLVSILPSVIVVTRDKVSGIRARYGSQLVAQE